MKKNLVDNDLHSKAVRLCEGGVVECDGHWIRAVVIPEYWDPCGNCDMASVCHGDIPLLCAECDGYSGESHKLVFNYIGRRL